LQRLKYVQRTGQGVDIIFKEMISMGKPYPQYHAYSDAVSLTIFSSIEDVEFVKFIVQEQDKMGRLLSLAELIILRSEICTHMQIDDSFNFAMFKHLMPSLNCFRGINRFIQSVAFLVENYLRKVYIHINIAIDFYIN